MDHVDDLGHVLAVIQIGELKVENLARRGDRMSGMWVLKRGISKERRRESWYLGEADLQGGGNEGVEVVRVTEVEVLFLSGRGGKKKKNSILTRKKGKEIEERKKEKFMEYLAQFFSSSLSLSF